MSTWEYRVVRRVVGGEQEFRIHEIHYDDENQLTAWSLEPVAPAGESLEELAADLLHMTEATQRPMLEDAALPRYSQDVPGAVKDDG